MTDLAFYRRDGEVFHPLDAARGLWGADLIHGVAISGLIGRRTEAELHALGRDGMVPARYHVELFRPARMRPTTVTAHVVRNGPRLVMIDAEFQQDGETLARATTKFLQPGEAPTGKVWGAGDRPTPPPLEEVPVSDEPRVPHWASDHPWSNRFSEHQNAGRHSSWQVPPTLVLGEETSVFAGVAACADGVNMVCNWGENGVEYINSDISLCLSRLPVSLEIGMRSMDHLAHDGVSIGVAEVYDRQGPIGSVSTTAVANTRRTVKFTPELDEEYHSGTPGA